MKDQDWKPAIRQKLRNANATLQEVSTLISLRFYNTAVNRIYYACFYAVSALLLQKNIIAHSHKGVRNLFHLHFVQTGLIPEQHGKHYNQLFDSRLSGDYEDFFQFEKQKVEELFINAQKLIQTIEAFLQTEQS